MSRLEVLKTYKLFIGGQFPRTESGRYTELRNSKNKIIANLCLASRKDFRNAQVSARNAFPTWSSKSAFNRGQILYRIAEMLEGRKSQFVEELLLMGYGRKNANAEVVGAIDRLIYYAGWCDKYSQIFSAVNPVASSHYNFSVPEPTGVVSIIAPESALLGLVSVIAPVIAGGNTCVIVASERYPLSSITFAEVLATSDLPTGVVNVLTGTEKELHGHFSSHMDVNAIIYCGKDLTIKKTIAENCSMNVKRFIEWDKSWDEETAQGPYFILDLQEIKTTWHPIENLGGSSVKY